MAAEVKTTVFQTVIETQNPVVYLGFYTREEKMCPEDAVFLQHSIESVVSIERLLEKR